MNANACILLLYAITCSNEHLGHKKKRERIGAPPAFSYLLSPRMADFCRKVKPYGMGVNKNTKDLQPLPRQSRNGS